MYAYAVDQVSSDLVASLGSFWTSVFRDVAMVEALMDARTELDAELAARYDETKAVLSAVDLPVFKRERVLPVVLSRSGRQRGEYARVRTGSPYALRIGPQSDPLLSDAPLAVGGYLDPADAVSYALPAGIVAVGSVSDRYKRAEHVLEDPDVYIARSSLVFRRDKDPFENGWGGSDQGEITVWLRDVSVDADYVSRFLAYWFGLSVDSSERSRDAIVGLVELVSGGHNIDVLKSVLGLATGEGASTVEAADWSRNAADLEASMPLLWIPPGMLSTREGIGFPWHESDITSSGGVYRFEAVGDAIDVDLFFRRLDQSLLEPWLQSDNGRISPAGFVSDIMLYSNAVFVNVERPFTLHALDKVADLAVGALDADMFKAVHGLVVSEGENVIAVPQPSATIHTSVSSRSRHNTLDMDGAFVAA